MGELPPECKNAEELDVDEKELAELDRRIERAKTGRWYTSEEVRDWMERLFANWREHGGSEHSPPTPLPPGRPYGG